MIITIKNFGPIKEFEFDTDTDFMLMVGENNVGKSYAVTLVYLVIKVFLRGKERIYRDNEFYSEVSILLDFLSREVLPGAEEVSLTDAINKSVKELFERTFINRLSRSMQNTFNSLPGLNNRYNAKLFEVTLRWNKFSVTLTLSDNLLKVSDCLFFEKVVLDNSGIKISPFFGCELRNDGRASVELLQSLLFKQLTDFFGAETNCFGVGSIYYLPASKSGLYLALSAFGSIFAALSRERDSISKPLEIPAIPEPLSDYFLWLSNIELNNVFSPVFSSYVEEIEQDIIRGKVLFDTDKKRLLFSPIDLDLSLDLSATSSMVSEVAPLTAFLKYILPLQSNFSPKNSGVPLIIFEEPEAHIHPANQIKLIKVLAKLVKDGKIKLIITSHSNYLFNQCSNLVMDGSIDAETFRGVFFKATETGSEAIELEVDRYGIEDNNFVDVAEAIFEEKMALFEKVNATI